jgi:DNA repair exonuclease SbcCD nuclease subunit
VQVYAIQGQHGRAELPWTSIDDYVIHLQNTVVKAGVVTFTGFDQTSPDNLRRQLECLDPEVNMLVMHQLMRGTVPDIDDMQTWDLDPAWVPVHVRLVLLGDFHEVWEHRTDHTLFVYNGSTALQSIDESSDKSFLCVDIDDASGEIKLSRVPLKTRRHWRVVVQASESLEVALAEISRMEPGSVVQVKYNTDLPGVEQAVRAANPAIHFMFRPLPRQLVSGEARIDTTRLPEVSLEGCLGLALDREKEPHAHDLTLSLLKSGDPRATLAETREHFMQTVTARKGPQ